MPRSTTYRRIALAVLLLCPCLAGADWPRFLGSTGNAAVAEADVPAEWNATTNVRWKQKLPGFGASSPIVVNGVIYLTYYEGYGLDEKAPGEQQDLRRHLMALDLKTGETLWDQEARAVVPETPYQGFQALHGYASSTPACDGENVFVLFGKSGAGAVSTAGKPLWQRSVGSGLDGWGSAASVVLYKDLAIFNASIESGEIVALKKADGEVAWRTPDIQRSWTTPVLVEVDGGQELVVSAENKILGLDPATGEVLWNCQGITDYVCPSPIVGDGVIYVIGGRRATAIAVRPGGRGDVTETHRLWEIPSGGNVSSPVYHQGRLYGVHESRGTAYCVDAKSGEVFYEERLNPRPNKIYASAVIAGEKLYYVSRENGVFVLQAGPEFKQIAYNEALDPSTFDATPVVLDDGLLLRSNEYLYYIGK